ncbi:MAG: AraC family transcriptional regulator [Vicinamibacterales bacterium]
MARRFDPVHLGSPRFRTLERGPFLVTEAWFPPGLGLPPHEHDRAVVAVTLEGGWDSVMLARPYACARGTLLIEPAGERHSNRFGTCGGRVLVLQPDLADRDALGLASRALEYPMAFGSAAAALVARRLRDEIHAPDALTPLAIEALSLELLVVASRGSATADRRPPAWLARVVEHVQAHARESLTLAGLAAVGGVHPAHLTRAFRRHEGTSVASFVRGLRLAWAAERLAASHQSIAEIAAEAGFADQSHFTRAFRARTGRTPRQYRERATV